MDNVIGMLGNLGAFSFIRNEPLVPEDLRIVEIKDKFYELNPIFHETIKTIRTEIQFPDGIKSSSSNYHFLSPINGNNYNGLISKIYDLFQDYYFILHYTNCCNVIYPIGLLTTLEPISLCFLTNIDNNDFIITQEKIFPFELSEKKAYIVINIEKSEEDLCVDETFQTISIIDIESRCIETYIRIVFKNKRWSDWTKYDENVSLNINILKLEVSFNDLQNLLVSQLLPINDYEIKDKIYKTCYIYYFDECNILILNNKYIFNYNLDTKYKLKNINFFEINFDFNLSSYISFVSNVMNNITYTPSNDLIEFHYTNKKNN